MIDRGMLASRLLVVRNRSLPDVAYGAKRATIVDVGRLADVSVKTVSRVLSAAPHVSDALTRRVRAAVIELDYHPNAFAQALVSRRSHLLGLIYASPSSSYMVELQKGVLKRLDGERFRLVVIPIGSTDRTASDLLALVQSAAIDGLMIAPPLSDHAEFLALLDRAEIAYARIAPTVDLGGGPSNTIDEVAAARSSVAFLHAAGHREIGFIAGDPTHPSSDVRLLGYDQAQREAGFEIRPDRVENGMSTCEGGRAAAGRLLSSSNPPTAILAMNDDMAAGALTAARELGLSVPDDLSIVGFDDSEVSRMTWPPLTTVRQPIVEMAMAATDMVLAQLGDDAFVRHRRHPFELVVRGSTAPRGD